jgi:hypothetical protein
MAVEWTPKRDEAYRRLLAAESYQSGGPRVPGLAELAWLTWWSEDIDKAKENEQNEKSE